GGACWKEGLAHFLLAGDVGLGGLALDVERVELLLQTFLGGLAGVDGTADLGRSALFGGLIHAAPPRPARAHRKKWKPLQWAPVTALATALSDLYVCPAYAKLAASTSTCRVWPL